MNQPQRVWVDLGKTDDERRVRLVTRGTIEDLQRLGIHLRAGMTLQVYSDDLNDAGERDDLIAEGIVHRSDDSSEWVLVIDWSAVRHELGGTH